MNRAERRRQAKQDRQSIKKNGMKTDVTARATIDQAVASMIQPIVTLLNARRFEEAEKALGELLEARPNHPEGLHLYGLLLCQTGREGLGIEKLRAATELSPETALYWNNLSTALSRAQLFQESMSASQRAVALDPSYEDARRNLVQLLLSADDMAGAIIELERLTARKPTDAQSWHQLAQCYEEQNKFELAEAAYKKVLAAEPEHIAAMRGLAVLYTNNWQYEAAQRLLRQADQLEKAGQI
ncbi:tetratricopeptide repeat protein [Dongia soli]|uniref:Tetratricopeptide repeat protein n=1 Tax=Dongia soli TaxID=600628 RepID=A0ABU5EA05_9PROT|nr:tetratricopeptide repeat protein [Dongia soli]MDY0882825.1 tetratricopeptide repeat protein [Dongia soli]